MHCFISHRVDFNADPRGSKSYIPSKPYAARVSRGSPPKPAHRDPQPSTPFRNYDMRHDNQTTCTLSSVVTASIPAATQAPSHDALFSRICHRKVQKTVKTERGSSSCRPKCIKSILCKNVNERVNARETCIMRRKSRGVTNGKSRGVSIRRAEVGDG